MKLFKTVFIFIALATIVCLFASCGLFTNEPQKKSEVQKETTTEQKETKNDTEIHYEISYKNVASWINTIGIMRIQVIAEITNTGEIPIYLSTSSYDLEDSNGQIIASKQLVSTYPDVIEPGEKGYLYDETSLDNIVYGQITVVPRISAKKATVSCIRYESSEISISDTNYYGPKIVGRITNSTDKDETGLIYVVAILYSNNNIPIGVLTDVITDDFPKGARIGFEATTLSMPDTITSNSIASYKIYAYPVQYQF